ncbi:hypothetical protein BGX38DRAFT_1334668 [Terfezia claveryi]|nr:hypothetical protein BGX38DRAFT_1334668 [Terfezia claveryi]
MADRESPYVIALPRIHLANRKPALLSAEQQANYNKLSPTVQNFMQWFTKVVDTNIFSSKKNYSGTTEQDSRYWTHLSMHEFWAYHAPRRVLTTRADVSNTSTQTFLAGSDPADHRKKIIQILKESQLFPDHESLVFSIPSEPGSASIKSHWFIDILYEWNELSGTMNVVFRTIFLVLKGETLRSAQNHLPASTTSVEVSYSYRDMDFDPNIWNKAMPASKSVNEVKQDIAKYST